MGRKIVVGVMGGAVLFLAVWTGPASAGPERASPAGPGPLGTPGHGRALAAFEDRVIDLGDDWGEARACLVWRQGGVVECFRTPEALDARSAQLAPGRAEGHDTTSTEVSTLSLWSCSGALRLYDYSYYGGRQLMFWDRGYWQNLGDYGFDDRTSSYAVGGCYVHLAEHPDGWGWWYPGATYPWAGEPVMGWGWSNVVSSIYIE